MQINLISFSGIRRSGVLVALAGALSALSGCRFGNFVQKADDPASLSGYYKTEAQSMSVCAYLDGSQDWRCSNASTTMIPGVIQSIMTNPVYVSANTTKAKAYLISNTLDTSNYFEMTLDRSGELSAEISVGESKPLWSDEACQTQLQLGKEGIIRGGTPTKEGTYQIQGTVDFSVAVITSLNGTCASTLSELKSCYVDSSKCPGSTPQEQTEEQQSVRDYFAPYIDHGVLTVDEIPQVVSFGWEATYR